MFPGFHRVLDCYRGLTRGFLQIEGFSYKKFRCFVHRDSDNATHEPSKNNICEARRVSRALLDDTFLLPLTLNPKSVEKSKLYEQLFMLGVFGGSGFALVFRVAEGCKTRGGEHQGHRRFSGKPHPTL